MLFLLNTLTKFLQLRKNNMPRTISPEFVVVHYWEDAYGTYTCHLNVPGLSFKETYLGKVFLKDVNNLPLWFYQVKGGEAVGPFNSNETAKEKMNNVLNAKTLSEHD